MPRIGPKWETKVGIHCGPAVAGIMGNRQRNFDLWGDTVNTASRMESHGAVGAIQVSPTTRQLLDPDRFATQPRGAVAVKGLGTVETWWLTGAADAVAEAGS